MTYYREQAIRDVAEAWDESEAGTRRVAEEFPHGIVAYAVAQRECVLGLEARLEDAENKLRAHDGLVALKNGIPETTGDPVFDQVLRIYPVAEMLQRGWLGSATGFDDLPFLRKSLLRFFEASNLSDLLEPNFWRKSMQLQQKEVERG